MMGISSLKVWSTYKRLAIEVDKEDMLQYKNRIFPTERL